MIKEKNIYLNLFGVSEENLKTLVAEGLAGGGDYCDLYFENTRYGSLTLRDTEVSAASEHNDYGVGIRALKGEKTGYAYSESTAMPDMLSAARAASAISGNRGGVEIDVEKALKAAHDRADSFISQRSNGSRMVRKFFPGEPNPYADRYPILLPWTDIPASQHIGFLTSIDKAVRARDSRIIKVIVNLSWSVSDVLMFNSLCEMKYDTRPMGVVVVSAVFSQNGKTENKSVSRGFRCGAELLSEKIAKELVDNLVKGIDERFEAITPKGGDMKVVMGAGASGILLHEAMGHAFEADFNRKEQSIFKDKMGKRICPQGINIVDDATIKGNRGALNYDDEGVPGQKTYMVEDGVLTSYLHDRISARYYGVTPTGNGRRESFRFAPIPRMRATYMESGNADPASLIAEAGNGIYVDDFANGQVQIGEGDFTFYVKSGFLIENGRLGAPVKDINIIGNGPKALEDILAVGNDLIVDEGAWTCGKGQEVPVSCGIPSILVKSLTVGGV